MLIIVSSHMEAVYLCLFMIFISGISNNLAPFLCWITQFITLATVVFAAHWSFEYFTNGSICFVVFITTLSTWRLEIQKSMIYIGAAHVSKTRLSLWFALRVTIISTARSLCRFPVSSRSSRMMNVRWQFPCNVFVLLAVNATVQNVKVCANLHCS